MPNVLITGANRGLGLEFARQYAADGWTVFASCRHPDEAVDLNALTTTNDVRVMRLDVTNADEVGQAAEELTAYGIDLLINNAGIYGPLDRDSEYEARQPLSGLEESHFLTTMQTNAFAPLRVSRAFLAHLRRGEGKTIATLSSKMGSIADNSSGAAYYYRMSKCALNMGMKSLSVDLAPEHIKVLTFHPGWVETDMGGGNALITPDQSVAGMRRVIDGATEADSGRFIAYDGRDVPW